MGEIRKDEIVFGRRGTVFHTEMYSQTAHIIMDLALKLEKSSGRGCSFINSLGGGSLFCCNSQFLHLDYVPVIRAADGEFCISFKGLDTYMPTWKKLSNIVARYGEVFNTEEIHVFYNLTKKDVIFKHVYINIVADKLNQTPLKKLFEKYGEEDVDTVIGIQFDPFVTATNQVLLASTLEDVPKAKALMTFTGGPSCAWEPLPNISKEDKKFLTDLRMKQYVCKDILVS